MGERWAGEANATQSLLTVAKFGNKFPKMDAQVKNFVRSAVVKLLRPVVRLCLDHGLSLAELTELTRQVAVAEAPKLLKRDGAKTTNSSIASITGLSRKEVARLQNPAADDLLNIRQRRDRATRVISGWVNDPVFSNNRHPLLLPMYGEINSFQALVKKYGGDVTPVAMHSLLSRTGNISTTDNTVELVSEAYIPTLTPKEQLEIFGTDGSELLETIAFNMTTSNAVKRFQRKVSNGQLDPKALETFKRLNEQEAMALLERYDTWLSQHEAPASSETASYVSVGIYFYENHLETYNDAKS